MTHSYLDSLAGVDKSNTGKNGNNTGTGTGSDTNIAMNVYRDVFPRICDIIGQTVCSNR
jgi:hypothetical protein